ncbi:MAG: FAD:protein FMN transferase [Deferribacteres bacterium]|nr:FAD:protein FMN transferase [candidate division KSB1 bacterium]MCB9503830.1 FAD:protein FMN transferase [Deferribacteres bacterium]
MNKHLTTLFLLLLSFLLLSYYSTTPQTTEIEMDGLTMGTSYMVKVVASPEQASPGSQTQLQKEIDALLHRVDKEQMSTYSKTSELSQFNQYKQKEWFPISSELALVVVQSHEIFQQTGGAFDITVGPLVNLWGFGPAKQQSTVPSEAAIAECMLLVGQNHVSVRTDPPALKKDNVDIYCDLSAIAKGFAVDAVAEYLVDAGFANYLVEIGGEVRAGGTKANGETWRIGIATPTQSGGIQKVVHLDNTGMATSGDYFNYFEKDGKRYSHTIDPVTGRPITHKLASVTVIHPSCMTADGYATAIDVMGPEKGFEFAQERNLAVFMIVRTDKGFVEKLTPEFKALFKIK